MMWLDFVLKSKLLFYFYFIECLYVGVYLIVLLMLLFFDNVVGEVMLMESVYSLVLNLYLYKKCCFDLDILFCKY